MTDAEGGKRRSIREFLGCLWAFTARPSAKISLGVLAGGGFAAGIIFWGGFNWALELTNTEAFCISCHEMRNTVYAEMKPTPHYANRTGVRATCPDCHVPKEWVYKVRRKIAATNELFHKIAGTLDTPEKFEAKRLELASNVWRVMKKTDSRECRNCHAMNFMDVEKQVRPAKRRHAEAGTQGKTCIDCHQGVAHKLPKDWEKTYERVTGVAPPK
jgi:cytochrome c-type protein NapC